GQWIVQHLSFPQKDGFTYTQGSRDYLDSNGLYQILLYGFFRAFGYSSLTLLNAGLLLAVFSFLWIRLKATPAPPWALVLFFLAAISGMERRFIVRPEIFSWLYLSLTLWVLDRRFSRGRNLLFLLPLLQWLWVNTEGLFMLGWAALATYILSGRIHWKKWDRPLISYSLGSVFVGILNPYGWRGLWFPFTLWKRLQDSSPYKQTIAEFFSPWRTLTTQNLGMDRHFHLFLFFAIALAGLLLIAVSFRQRKFHELVLLTAFLFLAVRAQRNIPLFMLVALPILAACLSSFKTTPRWGWLSQPRIAWVLVLFTLLWCLRVATNAYYIGDRRNERIGFGVDSQVLPVKAAQFLVQNGLNGRMLNDLNSGGWLDWQAPQPTFVDGRLEVPEESFFRQMMQSFTPGGLIPLLAATDAQLVVVEYNTFSPWVDQLNRFSNWRLLYLDECTAIYARSDYAPQFPALSWPALTASRGIPSETDASVTEQLESLTVSRWTTWFRGFYEPQTYAMGDFSMGLFAIRAKAYDPARNLLMEGLRRTNGDYPEVFLNLALANFTLRDLEMARLCLEYTLRLDPRNKRAAELLANFVR
ncbi:MAG TPA: hypothetical protein VJ873_01925, partial [bacterium]|nr:hypothetical protein [bacterium]